MKKTFNCCVCLLLAFILCVFPVISASAAENTSQDSVKVSTYLNDVLLNETETDNYLVLSYKLTAPLMIEDGQGTLTYDSSKLKLVSFKLPKITSSLTINKNLENSAKFNFTGVDSETNSGKSNFKNGGVFVQAEFEVVQGTTGSAEVNLQIEELDALENNKETEYISNNTITAEGTAVFNSMLTPTISLEKQNDEKDLKVSALLNNNRLIDTVVTDTLIISYNLTAPLMIEDGQGTLSYDSSKLKLVSFKMPKITSSLTINKSLDNQVKFNFTGVDSETNSGKSNFKNGGVFVEAEFEAVQGAKGLTDINLQVEELDALENGKEVEYISHNSVTSDGKSVFESMLSPTVSLEKQTEDSAKELTVSTLLNSRILNKTEVEDTISVSLRTLKVHFPMIPQN